MSYLSETYDIDGEGDVLLCVLRADLIHDGLNLEDDISEPDTLIDDASSLDTLVENGILIEDVEPQPMIAPAPVSRRAVRFRVNSNYLRRSSAEFARLLDEYVGSPGAAYQTHFPIRIPIWSNDPSTMGLILRIIHEDSLQQAADQEIQQLFPAAENHVGQIDLPVLARIATIAHNYQLESAVDDCLADWIDRLWTQTAASSMTEALDWVWVSWVFDLKDYFSAATSYLAKTSTQSLMNLTLEYPIPSVVIGAIDDLRTDALSDLCCLFSSQAEAVVRIATTRLKGAEALADSQIRDSMAIQETSKMGLLLFRGHELNFWPESDPEFCGTSYADAADTIRSMTIPKGDGVTEPNGRPSLGVSSIFNDQFYILLECLEARGWELELERFKTIRKTPKFTY